MAEFKFFCPLCGQHIQCDTSYSETQINCPVCQQAILVPPAPRIGASVVQPPVPAKSRALRNVLTVTVAVLILAGLVIGGWYGYSKFKIRKLPVGLVALWSGEGNGNDLVSGNKMELTDISFVKGKVGQAFSFNGTSSWINIPDNPVLDVGAGEGFTVTAWIKPSRVDGIYMGVEWCDYLCAFQLGLTPSDRGSLVASVFDSNRNNHFLRAGSGTIVPNVFQHIALTYDKTSGIGTLYVNGTIVAQPHFDSIVPLTKGGLRIGYRPGNPGDWSYNRFFTGLMDEIAIYNRALSAAEIQEICKEQNNGKLPPPPTSARGGRFGGGVISH
jgi:hypothetical protein